MNITIDGKTQSVKLADNEATRALTKKLQEAPINVTLNTNGDFEIWGALGFSLPRADEWFDARPGDVVLYSGSNICIFYGSNTYSYTRLGMIEGLSAAALKTFLKGGQNNITVTLSLTEASGISQVKAQDEKNVCYSLNGQRTGHPSKGVYIKNGKKVIL